ncbi:MAG: aldo/keto reductase [Chitinispirillaceae bacterium]|nr:aldo/keto reductase [Chitinispirillaceae bacterium]
MNYRKMGSLPWEVSALGFGCMRLPTSGIIPLVNERTAIEIIRYGIDRGINYMDTAWMYHMGQSEKVLGRALAGGYREKVKLVTKLPMIFVRKTADFERYLDEQLARLQTEYLDIYLFHMLNQVNFDKMKKLELLAKMEKARDAGKLRHIGFSFHDTLPVFKQIIDFYPWEMAQIQYNYMDTGVQATTEGLQYAHAKGIAVVIMEPLKGGQLASPPAEAQAIIDQAPVKRTPVDWALQFLWNRPEVACVLSGMGSMKMVEENCSSAERSGIGSLTDEENKVIDTLAETYRQKIIVPCTSCHYCMPCPSGVNIPQNFALLNNKSFLRVGKFSGKIVQWMVSRNYRHLAKNSRQLAENKENGRASLCTKCNACVPKCPQKIAIPQELEKVAAVFEKGKKIASLQG